MWTAGGRLRSAALLFGHRRGFLPTDPQDFNGPSMPHRNASFFHLHLVSDSTGETLITVARAACAQYVNAAPVEHVYPAVRTSKQLDRVLAEIEASPGVILYTLLDQPLIEPPGRQVPRAGLALPVVLGPVLSLFQSYLGAGIDP